MLLIKTKLGKFIQIAIYISIVVASNAGLAQSRVVIIPMAGDDLKPLKNIITVAKENGDFTSPGDALDAIGTTLSAATENNPYLVVIAPGRYSLLEPLVMQEYVDIAGSGQNVTTLSGYIGTNSLDASSAIVVGENHASLRDLTIENLGGSGAFSIGIYNHSASPLLSNITVNMYGNDKQYGVVNSTNSRPVISYLTMLLNNGTQKIGMTSNASFPIISNTKITVSNGSQQQAGISSYALSPATSRPIISNTIIEVSGGSSNIGLRNSSATASMIVRNSTVDATTSIAAGTGIDENQTYISDSFLKGSVTGSPQCSFVFKTDGTALNPSCQ